jgi:hypothetical protein
MFRSNLEFFFINSLVNHLLNKDNCLSYTYKQLCIPYDYMSL